MPVLLFVFHIFLGLRPRTFSPVEDMGLRSSLERLFACSLRPLPSTATRENWVAGIPQCQEARALLLRGNFDQAIVVEGS